MTSNKTLFIIILIALGTIYFFIFKEKTISNIDISYEPTSNIVGSLADTSLTAANIYNNYMENTLAFNEKNEGKLIEFKGTISDVTTTFLECGVIVFAISDVDGNSLGQINCMNCKNGKDKWKKELLELKVNDEIVVKGNYSSAITENTLNFNNCSISKQQ